MTLSRLCSCWKGVVGKPSKTRNDLVFQRRSSSLSKDDNFFLERRIWRYSSSKDTWMFSCNFHMWMPVEMRAWIAPVEPPLFLPKTVQREKRKDYLKLSCGAAAFSVCFLIIEKAHWTHSATSVISPKVMILYRKRSVPLFCENAHKILRLLLSSLALVSVCSWSFNSVSPRLLNSSVARSGWRVCPLCAALSCACLDL